MGFRRRRLQAGDPLGRTFAQAKACGSGSLVRCRFSHFLVWHRFVTGAICILPLLAAGGCSENEGTQTSSRPEKKVPKLKDILIFPDKLRVKDESANRFLTRAMKICGEGKYEPFRLLWSVKEQPLPRGDFDRGWQAVQEIRIRAFQQVLLAGGDSGERTTGETVYVVLADVSLDPTHRAGERQPHREVALMLVREKGDWRLAKAPAEIRKWVKEIVEKAAPVDARTGDGSLSIDDPKRPGKSGEQTP